MGINILRVECYSVLNMTVVDFNVLYDRICHSERMLPCMYTWLKVTSPNDLVQNVLDCLLLFSFEPKIRPCTIRWEYDAQRLIQLSFEEEASVATIRVLGPDSFQRLYDLSDDRSVLISILQEMSASIDTVLFKR
jgi:hypothetical protein